MQKSTKKRTSIYIEQSLFKELRYLAVAKDKRFNDCVREAIEEYLERNRKFIPKIK